MTNSNMTHYGVTEQMENRARREGLLPGRVTAQYGQLYRVTLGAGDCQARVSGRFAHEALKPADFPVTGDFVLLEGDSRSSMVIREVFPRKSALGRRAAGTVDYEQIIAANVDTLFLCMACNEDFNIRRMERYLAAAWKSGARPVVLLTKADLARDTKALLGELRQIAEGADILLTSASEGSSMEVLAPYLKPRETLAFVGSSGVGKSTIINCLAGEELLIIGDVRSDGRGRHTSTRRELLLLPGGTLVIDTPGMREFALDSADMGKAFPDIEELAAACRFDDCAHMSEPGCAVLAAAEAGTLSRDRLRSYQRLCRESSRKRPPRKERKPAPARKNDRKI